jgi:hypothetical protein
VVNQFWVEANPEQLFITLSSLVNVKFIGFEYNNLSSIPLHAFRKLFGSQIKLDRVDFGQWKVNEYETIYTIGNYSFYNLNNLER